MKLLSLSAMLLASALLVQSKSYAYDSKSVAMSALDEFIVCAQNHAKAMNYKTKSEMDASKPGANYCASEDRKFRTLCSEYERERPDLGKVCGFSYVMETMKMYNRLGLK